MFVMRRETLVGPMFIEDKLIGVSSTIQVNGTLTIGHYTNLLHEEYLSFLRQAVRKHGADIRGLTTLSP